MGTSQVLLQSMHWSCLIPSEAAPDFLLRCGAEYPQREELSAAAPSLTMQDIFHLKSCFCCSYSRMILGELWLNLSILTVSSGSTALISPDLHRVFLWQFPGEFSCYLSEVNWKQISMFEMKWCWRRLMWWSGKKTKNNRKKESPGWLDGA